MRARSISFYVAWLAIALNGCWLALVLFGIVHTLLSQGLEFEALLLSLAPLLFAVPMAVGLVYAVRLLKRPQPDNIKWTVGVLAYTGIFWTIGSFSKAFFTLGGGPMLALALSMGVFLAGYLFCCKTLINRETGTRVGLIDLMTKEYLFFVSLALFILLIQLTIKERPLKAEDIGIWRLIAHLLPFVLPVVFYKTVNAWVAKRRQGPCRQMHAAADGQPHE
ncbi:hypothetical protein H5P28_08255 [Ruficoccus amylovorans]|uniref:Uncharacterized protein n=1 Tax=Ruficoccus amylovorans TaxID=1804625 RepID=A0A842HCR4_9BACT|nr:hypothetical protein [Ruficoccus amylovorans]MBC2594253.1 hypothetical protein [Ruficoccus amylovorans]